MTEIRYYGTKFNVDTIKGTTESDFLASCMAIPQLCPQVPRKEREHAYRELWGKFNPKKKGNAPKEEKEGGE